MTHAGSKRKLLLAALAVAMALLLWVLVRSGFFTATPGPAPEGVLPSATPGSLPEPSRPPSPVPAQSLKSSRASQQEWKELRDRLGGSVRPEFDSTGCLSSIRSTGPSKALPSRDSEVSGFDPTQAKSVIDRARRIVEMAASLLCIRPSSLLATEVRDVKTDPASSQVAMKQVLNGVPIEPHGNLTINLGREGELLGLYSDFVSDVRIGNQIRLNADNALSSARNAVLGKDAKLRDEGGRLVIWIATPRGESGVAEGRYAYEYLIQGYQVLIDAETGAVLQKRDRRVF